MGSSVLPCGAGEEETVRIVGRGCSPFLLASHAQHKGPGYLIGKTYTLVGKPALEICSSRKTI